MNSTSFSIEVIGLTAAVLTTASFVPQVYKIWKSKSAEGVSLTMFLMFFIGVILWTIYGFSIESLSVTIANSITALLAFVIVYYKLKYKA